MPWGSGSSSGEGALAARLRAAYPQASITAIDITPRVGRLYGGPAGGVRFLQCDIEHIAATEAGRFDLVLLCDVLHHVPRGLRHGLLDAIRTTLAPGGTFIFKDWERNHAPIHWLCYASDRWLTGDRISYLTGREMREILAASFGAAALGDEARIAPWWNNIATVVRP
jgi:SAM-dependent methyltransferase